MATQKRKKVVIRNSTVGNVVTGGGNIKNLRMYTSLAPSTTRQVDDDYCGSPDADFVLSGSVTGNLVLSTAGIENTEMYTVERDGYDDRRSHQQETCGHSVQEMDSTDSSNVYKLSPDPRGRVLIIDNLAGTHDHNISNADRLHKMWLDLGYFPYTHKNLTAQQLMSEVKKFSKKGYLKYTGCIIMMIMSYGNKKEIKGSDGVPVSIDGLKKNFDLKNCPNMADKPKLMFFEYCEEDEVDVDFPVENQKLKGQKSDTLTIYKNSSKGEIQGGSNFIKNIDRVFREGADKLDLDALLRKVEGVKTEGDTLNKTFYFQQDKM